MKLMKVFLGITIAVIIGGIMMFDWNELGKSPRENDLTRIKASANYNPEKGRFVNRKTQPISEVKKRNINWKVIKEWFTPGIDRVPANKLPELKPDLTAFLEPSKDLKTIWFGHSSFLMNMGGNIILVDPVFSEAASPIKSFVKRFQKPILELEELPEINYILISHDHYDHLDMKSIKFFMDKDVTFVTPLGVGSHLKKWGIPENRIIEKDWWQTANFDSISFTATPAHHFSGRNGLDANATLWASWVIKNDDHNVYFSGDSGYDTHFKDIGTKYGPFDVAFIESGQYNENWQDVHMLPSEGVQAFKDLKAEKYFPIHWGMFELSLHTWYDPIKQLYQYSKSESFELLAPKIGQIVNIDYPDTNEIWWEQSTLTALKKEQPAKRCANSDKSHCRLLTKIL